MYEGLISEIIEEFWRVGFPSDLVVRDLFDIRELFVKPRKIITIVGLRRVGKTYALLQLAREIVNRIPRERIFYLNFEDERVPQEKELLSDVISLIRSRVGRLEDAVILLDELHIMPEWDRWLYRLYEREKPAVAVTGSTSKLSLWDLPRELRGRCLTYQLFPLRFWEFLKFRGEKISGFEEWDRAKLISLFEEYLRFGGLPEVVLSPTYRRLRILQDYYWTIVTRDIAERHGVNNISLLSTVLKYVANTVYFSASKLHNILKSAGYRIGKEKILNYADYAEECFFIHQVPHFHERASQKIILPRKIYIGDAGFITALATRKAKLGRLLENMVFIELMRRYYHDPTIEISYLTFREGEVDFIVSKGVEIVEVIQVCYDPTDIETKQREIPPLVSILKRFRIKRGTVITASYEAVEKYGTKEIAYIPYTKWEQRQNKHKQNITKPDES